MAAKAALTGVLRGAKPAQGVLRIVDLYLCFIKSHPSDKGCAVRAALAEGRLSQTRYDSYCAMYEEVKDVKDWQRPKV